MGLWLLCWGFGAVLGVGSYSVGLGWFVAEDVVAVGMTVGFSLGYCAGVTVPLLWRVCLCVTVGLGCCDSWRVRTRGLWTCGGSFWGAPWGFIMGVLLWREKGREDGFLGLCGDVRGVGVLGREGLKILFRRGCCVLGCVLVGLVVFVRGLRPVPPCFWSVGGGAVRAEDAGLCVVKERGLSPHTPVVNGQGCPSPF